MNALKRLYSGQTLGRRITILSLPFVILECLLLVQLQIYANNFDESKKCHFVNGQFPTKNRTLTFINNNNNNNREDKIIDKTLKNHCFNYANVYAIVLIYIAFDLTFVICGKVLLKLAGYSKCSLIKEKDGLHLSSPLLIPWLINVHFETRMWFHFCLLLLMTAILMNFWYRDYYTMLRSSYNGLIKCKLLKFYDFGTNRFERGQLVYTIVSIFGLIIYLAHLIYYTLTIPLASVLNESTAEYKITELFKFLLLCAFISPFPRLPFSAILFGIYHSVHIWHPSNRHLFCFPALGRYVAVEEKRCLNMQFCPRQSRIVKTGNWPIEGRLNAWGDRKKELQMTNLSEPDQLPDWMQTKYGMDNLRLLISDSTTEINNMQNV